MLASEAVYRTTTLLEGKKHDQHQPFHLQAGVRMEPLLLPIGKAAEETHLVLHFDPNAAIYAHAQLVAAIQVSGMTRRSAEVRDLDPVCRVRQASALDPGARCRIVTGDLARFR